MQTCKTDLFPLGSYDGQEWNGLDPGEQVRWVQTLNSEEGTATSPSTHLNFALSVSTVWLPYSMAIQGICCSTMYFNMSDLELHDKSKTCEKRERESRKETY